MMLNRVFSLSLSHPLLHKSQTNYFSKYKQENVRYFILTHFQDKSLCFHGSIFFWSLISYMEQNIIDILVYVV